jgi:hypothetical protein
MKEIWAFPGQLLESDGWATLRLAVGAVPYPGKEKNFFCYGCQILSLQSLIPINLHPMDFLLSAWLGL